MEDCLNTLLPAGKAATKPEEIVKAARYSRVDTNFLSDDEHLCERFDGAEDRVVAHGSAVGGDIDPLHYAALVTLRNRGAIAFVDRAALPPFGLAAATLRY